MFGAGCCQSGLNHPSWHSFQRLWWPPVPNWQKTFFDKYLLATNVKEKVLAKRFYCFYVLTEHLDEDPKFLYENHWKCIDNLSFAELNVLIENQIQFLGQHTEESDFLLVARAVSLSKQSI